MGIEPMPRNLRGCCSAAELPALIKYGALGGIRTRTVLDLNQTPPTVGLQEL